MNPALQSLEEWGNSLCPQCVQKVKQSISAASLVKRRDGFGQTVRPVPGSVLASTATDLSGGEPDYFFHWLRDSAIVMNAMRLMATIDENLEAWIIAAFDDFAKFSLKLRSISGREFLNSHGLPAKVAPELRQYLRPDSEIRTVEGMRVLGEARYNADGTLDFIRWSRPQHDGPALRALAAMRFADGGFSLSGGLEQRLASLIRFDLDYTVLNAGEPCFDIWEEEPARHYYTTLVQYAALQMGAKWAHRREEQEYASYLQALTLELYKLLGKFWSDRQGIYRSRIPSTGEDTPKDLDFSVILGVIHAGLEDGAHSILDERVHHTLRQLETLFAREYAINRGPGPGLAYGRYENDRYYSGGAYYFCSFGAAEFYYRLAALSPAEKKIFLAKGDAILSLLRKFIPAPGGLSEQFDQQTGEQTSAKDLSWSYASFITAWIARRRAQEALQASEQEASTTR